MTLKELYLLGADTLESAGTDSPSVDAFYLLEYLTGLDRAHYLLEKEREVTSEAKSAYMDLIKRRAEHIPYQYITGEADFMGLKFKVTEDVLIPRLDTEVLLDEALKRIPDHARVLDMCTGSGCLAVSVKKFRPDTEVTACDISEKALDIARENADRILEGSGKIRFIKSDLFSGFRGAEQFDVIISNPPYVTVSEYEELGCEVKDHEPALALLAGEDGLDIYRRLIPEAAAHLKDPGGCLLLEIGCSQAEAVCAMLEESGFTDIETIKDLAGLDRVVIGRSQTFINK